MPRLATAARSTQGSFLIAALMILTGLGTLLTVGSSRTASEVLVARHSAANHRALFAAESGIEWATVVLLADFRDGGWSTGTAAPITPTTPNPVTGQIVGNLPNPSPYPVGTNSFSVTVIELTPQAVGTGGQIVVSDNDVFRFTSQGFDPASQSPRTVVVERRFNNPWPHMAYLTGLGPTLTTGQVKSTLDDVTIQHLTGGEASLAEGTLAAWLGSGINPNSPPAGTHLLSLGSNFQLLDGHIRVHPNLEAAITATYPSGLITNAGGPIAGAPPITAVNPIDVGVLDIPVQSIAPDTEESVHCANDPSAWPNLIVTRNSGTGLDEIYVDLPDPNPPILWTTGAGPHGELSNFQLTPTATAPNPGAHTVCVGSLTVEPGATLEPADQWVVYATGKVEVRGRLLGTNTEPGVENFGGGGGAAPNPQALLIIGMHNDYATNPTNYVGLEVQGGEGAFLYDGPSRKALFGTDPAIANSPSTRFTGSMAVAAIDAGLNGNHVNFFKNDFSTGLFTTTLLSWREQRPSGAPPPPSPKLAFD